MNCEICEGSPAFPVKLQSASSRIIWWNHQKYEGQLCGICAEEIYFRQQSRTLIQGWWGPISALATIWFSIMNFIRINEHRRQAPYVRYAENEMVRPKAQIHKNGIAMAVSAVALIIISSLVLNFATAPTPVIDSNPQSYASSCWSDEGNSNLKQVSCSASDAAYETYQVVSDPYQCEDLYISAGTEFACLRSMY